MAILAAALCLAGYAAGYAFYSRFLADRVFALDPERVTPAHALRDDIDYVPTNKYVLFGHHYASITGLAPMLGPAVAVIWGWVPALLWVVLGALLVGCVHDFSALVVSMRARGQSIGKVTEGIIGARAKTLFHLIIFFGIGLAMGVFVFVISKLFQPELGPGVPGYPQSVFPSVVILVLAVAIGQLTFRRQLSLGPLIGGAFVLTLVSIAIGMKNPTFGLSPEAWPDRERWSWILLAYAFAASVLPVWSLLQPRDFLNSLLLYLGVGLSYVGFFLLAPSFAAPAIVPNPEGAPPLFPFVFIVIACGAASGFHSLVSSGTTAKQLANESDARMIGYGGMIGESLLGLLAVLACTAGFASPESWLENYSTWTQAAPLATKIGNFIAGCATFMSGLGIPRDLGSSFISVVVVSFALTTLDSATRLLRYNISEIGETLRLPILDNRFLASGLAVGAIAVFAFLEVDGKPAGLALWQLFGTTNQLLAGLALLVVTLYLMQRGRPYVFTLVPMAFMLVSTLSAMVNKLQAFWKAFLDGGSPLLLIVGSTLFVLALWLTVEAGISVARTRGQKITDDLEVRFSD